MQVAIRLTEPVVFLRGDHSNPKRGHLPRDEIDQLPLAMVRGLLVLTLDKPAKISTIEVELEGICLSEWPEGMGSRRVEVFEEHRILHAKATFFNAAEEERERIRRDANAHASAALQRTRRHASLGPGLENDIAACDNSDSESSDGDSDSEGPVQRGRNRTIVGRDQALARLEQNQNKRPQLERHNSVDPYRQSHYPSVQTAITPTYHPIPDSSLGKTPPYTPTAQSPSVEELERLRLDDMTVANTRANGMSFSSF